MRAYICIGHTASSRGIGGIRLPRDKPRLLQADAVSDGNCQAVGRIHSDSQQN